MRTISRTNYVPSSSSISINPSASCAKAVSTSVPWKCIHYLSLDAIDEAVNVEHPATDGTNFGFFIVDEDECTRCALVRRPVSDERDHAG